ncbi:FtsK/SpoIIIE family DNA translocase [Lyticum sinuosum]|uniref:DNA translocase FtsK n=1 Tax=Lyticum sinuosum TaxID=1332059 RepID=A0AAE5AHN3_9RICK|nr:DNA translocase FtsK [Lyticum sinuosum]
MQKIKINLKQNYRNKNYYFNIFSTIKIIFILVFFAIFIISFLSYNGLDPSFLNTYESDKYHNIIGKAGANLSAFFLTSFGFIPSLAISIYFLTIILYISPKNENKLIVVIKIFFFTVFLLILCLYLSDMILKDITDIEVYDNNQYVIGAGGFIGYYLNTIFKYLLENCNIHIFSKFIIKMCVYIFGLICFFSSINYDLIFFLKKIRNLYKNNNIILDNDIEDTKINKKYVFPSFFSQEKKDLEKEYTNKDLDQNSNSENKLCFKTINNINISDKLYKEEINHYNNDSNDNNKYNLNYKEFQRFSDKNENYNQDNNFFAKKNDEINYIPLPVSLLVISENINTKEIIKEDISKISENLSQVLKDFGIKGLIKDIHTGPVIKLCEFIPAPGIKSSRIISLADDIARSMHSKSARVAIISGKNAIGIELPNEQRQFIHLREMIDHDSYQNTQFKLPLILGKSISGEPILADLAKMPHLLVAGTTGSGKSVAINTMIISLLYKYSPKDCRLILIDPKMLELSVYDGIPHLATPVVTDPKKAIDILSWAIKEMESRYRIMSILGVRNIVGYNDIMSKTNDKKITKIIQTGFDQQTKQPQFSSIDIEVIPLPYIVIIIDEMADLMIIAGKEIETYLQRLAQMARAAGIHIIMATQRPSVDVITGVIKANFPTRISFQVSSKIDSRTIIGDIGAEQLLGMGDMLYMMPGGQIERLHAPFVNDDDIERIVNFLKTQGFPVYVDLNDKSTNYINNTNEN